MRGYVLTENGPALMEVEAPKPRPGEIQARVHAAALNRVDIAMARGHVHGGAGGLGNVLGVEWAGEVTALGDGVTCYEIGQRVMGSGSGAFAEFTVADAGRELRREKNEFCHGPAPVWLSLAIIAWAGPITDAINGTAMEVDYVRMYERK